MVSSRSFRIFALRCVLWAAVVLCVSNVGHLIALVTPRPLAASRRSLDIRTPPFGNSGLGPFAPNSYRGCASRSQHHFCRGVAASAEADDATECSQSGQHGTEGPVVQFFHNTEPGLWDKLVAKLQGFASDCRSGRMVTTQALAKGVQGIRYLTNGHNPSLGALERCAGAVNSKGICDGQAALKDVFADLADLATQLPQRFGKNLPILVQGISRQVCLTRTECATLLAASLFGAIPGRSIQEKADYVRAHEGGESEARRLDLPSFDLGFLLEEEDEKLLCLLSYFAQVADPGNCRLDVEEVVSFARRAIAPVEEDYWRNLDEPLSRVQIHSSKGGIEQADGMLQADFANRYLGGGTLHRGAVQEEIRFCISPECIVGMLLCEAMLPNEAIYIVGARQSSKYTGYGDSFAFGGSHIPRQAGSPDGLKRNGPHIVAFDALAHPGEAQYGEELVLRELLKVRAACLGDPSEQAGARQVGFATGNWGCGAFGGDPQLKALVQWLAASSAGRELVYFPFGDRRVERLHEVVAAVQQSGARCKDLYRMLHGHGHGNVFNRVLKQAGE